MVSHPLAIFRIALAAMALVLATLSLFLNLATYFTDSIAGQRLDMGPWWFLHLTAIGMFAAAIVINPAIRGRRASPLASMPMWMKWVLGAAVVFTIFNIVTFALNNPHTPSLVDGRPALTQHGQVVRYITPAEYDHAEAVILRGFSGHWFLFHIIAAVFLLVKARPNR